MVQKLKLLARTAVVLLAIIAPFSISGIAAAADACTGSNAPAGTNCASIPLGCPGSTQQGPVVPTQAKSCPYKATTVGACRYQTCNYPDGTSDSNATASAAPAASQVTCPDGLPPVNAGTDCATEGGGNCSSLATDTNGNKCDLIVKYLNPAIQLLAALVGLAVVISIIIGGIQYGSAGADPAKISAAKNRIRNAIIALLVFLFLYALLNFLMPGGLL